MHILIVTDSYPPEIRSASHLMLELTEELSKRGHHVSVVTTWPQYNLEKDFNINNLREFEQKQNIDLLRIKSLPLHKVNYYLRGISQLLLPVLLLRKLKKYRLNKPDVVIVYSPPLTLGLVGAWLKRSGARFILNLQDLFPQNAIDLGILRNGILISFFRRLEKFLYQKADIVTVHSEGNRNILLQWYPELLDKYITLPNWIDINYYLTTDLNQTLPIFEKIKNKFVIIFAGVLGPSQGLDFLLQIAEHCQPHQDLLFLLVGDGVQKKILEKQVKQQALSNVQFTPFIKREDYPLLLSRCHVGVVGLAEENRTPVVPGKLLGYMAAGLPVFSYLNWESDGHQIVREANCGYSVVTGDLESAVEAIIQLYQSREKLTELGENGRRYIRQHCTKETCVDQLEKILTRS